MISVRTMGAAICLALVALAFWGAYQHGRSTMDDEWQTRWAVRDAGDKQAWALAEVAEREKEQAAERVRADIDARATKEKANDLAENERLRRAVDDSARRLRIAGSCRAGSENMPGAPSTAGMGNAGTVELAATAGRTVFDIRAGIIADQAALRGLQRYVQEVCR